MKISNKLSFFSSGFIILSAVSLLSVSMMAFFSPQAVMDLVQVQLPNTDAFSSIRGVYGGVGLTIFIQLVYLLRKNKLQALVFLSIFWGAYAFSRITTIFAEGRLGTFGTQWLYTELFFCAIAITLYVMLKRREAHVEIR